jgi:Tfp pilus assembly protein PilF
MLPAAAVLVLASPEARGQARPAAAQPVPPASFDPSEVFFQGWLLSRDAETLAEEGKPTEAMEKLRRAQQLFDTISRTFPDWKQDMVAGRRKQTFDTLAKIGPLALKEQQKQDRAIAEIEGGARLGGSTGGDPARPLDTGIPARPLPPTHPVESLESRRIAELERQVAGLQQQVRDAENLRSTDRAAREQARDTAVAQLHKARTELDRLRREVAEGPVQEEIDALARRINSLEDEKDVMARALDASRRETSEAKAQVEALNLERARLMQQVQGLEQKLANLNANLKIERQAHNEVVAGQIKQIERLQAQLDAKDRQLDEANGRIRSLETELAEVRASFDELKQERNELLRERDQMAALLNLTEGGQLQKVIDQNMELDRKLREAGERYEALQQDQDATSEDLLQALRALAISKVRIHEFRQKDEEQQQRLEELQARLRNERQTLDSAAGDPAEIALLRGIIDRQLKVQEKRAQARDMLLAALDDKASQDESIRRAVQLFRGVELNLSPEELAAIDGKVVDGVIISPDARPRDEVERNLADLDRELGPYRSAGIRAYRNDRLHAAREAFEMIIERHPGDDATMCMLGLVEYKLHENQSAADMFRRASELDPENPYAHRMLGHILSSRLDRQSEAIEALERATTLAPTNAEGHLLLGNACFRHEDLKNAEEAFRTALACEPTNAEAHYNLALLCERTGRNRDGMKHYDRALENGAPPNPELEESLGRQ